LLSYSVSGLIARDLAALRWTTPTVDEQRHREGQRLVGGAACHSARVPDTDG